MLDMSELSKKTIWGGAVAAVLLVVIVVRAFSGGAPDVSNGDVDQRLADVRKVAVSGSPDAGEILARVVRDDPKPRVRRVALAGLGRFLKPRHREVIRKSMKDTDAGVRLIAAETLGLYAEKYPDKSATVDLIAMVENEPEEEVIRSALRGLVKSPEPISIVTLLDRAENGTTNEIKRVAMKGLLKKLDVRIARERDPKYKRSWRDLIQLWKQSRRVQEAYKQAGVKLVQKPGDLMGKDWHPERRSRQ
jgi:hypothetical protein